MNTEIIKSEQSLEISSNFIETSPYSYMSSSVLSDISKNINDDKKNLIKKLKTLFENKIEARNFSNELDFALKTSENLTIETQGVSYIASINPFEAYIKFNDFTAKTKTFILDKLQIPEDSRYSFNLTNFGYKKELDKEVDVIRLVRQPNISIVLFKGKYFKLTMIPSMEAYKTALFKIEIFLKKAELKFIETMVGKGNIEGTLPAFIKFYAENDYFPPIYDPDLEIKPPILKGPVKLEDGSIFYMPKKAIDNRKMILANSLGKTRFDKNQILYIDDREGFFYYTNDKGLLKEYQIKSPMKLSLDDIVGLLEDTLGNLVTNSQSIYSVFNKWSIPGYGIYNPDPDLDPNSPKNIAQKYSNTIIKDIPIKEFQIFINDLQKNGYWANKTARSPKVYLQIQGVLEVLRLEAKKYLVIKEKSVKAREAFNNASIDDYTGVASMDGIETFFPHQGEAIPKLEHAGETAILDFSTGGGKTIIIIADILNLLKAKKIKRPLVIMPAKLIGQFMSAIKKFTKDKVNVVCFTAETMSDAKNWGEKKMKNLGMSAPRNTIFLSAYTTLFRGKYKGVMSNRYPMSEWLLTGLGIDYIALDECVVGSSLINTEYGIIPIENFGKNIITGTKEPFNIKLLAKEGVAKADTIYKGKSKTIKIESKFGYEIEGTPNHPVQVLNSDLELVWKYLIDIEEGDYITIQKSENLWTKNTCILDFKTKVHNLENSYYTPKKVTKSLAKVLGYLISEGSIECNNSRIVFTNSEKELQDDFKYHFKECFKVNCNQSKDGIKLYFDSEYLVKFIEYCGYKHLSHNKTIPWCILQSKKSIVSSFLKTYWEGDGKNSFLTSISKSKQLIKEIQVLLINYSIFSKITSNSKRFELHINRECVESFIKNIGFVTKTKNNKIKEKGLLEKLIDTKYVYKHIIPYIDTLRETIKATYGFDNGKYTLATGETASLQILPYFSKINPYKISNKNTSYLSSYDYIKKELKRGHIKLLDKLSHKKLEYLAKYKFFFDKIVSKTFSKEEKYVYDFKVPKQHNFVANGIVIHNSHKIKNDSATSEAALTLRSVKYRRIATGTLINNTVEDIIKQLSFLDPRLLGTRKEFLQKYALSHNGQKASAWKPDAKTQMFKAIKEKSSLLSYDEKDWGAALPKIKYNYHYAKMNPLLENIYSRAIQSLMDAINSPILNTHSDGTPKTPTEINKEKKQQEALQNAWNKFVFNQMVNPDSDEVEESDVVGATLLAQFAKLERIVSAPDISEVIKSIGNDLTDDQKMSPRLPIIDDLINSSLTKGEKVIISFEYKDAAKHCFENSKFKNKGAYYDAAFLGNLERFASKSEEVMVLFAVSKSLTEGFNLQVAGRVIICNQKWTPGDTKQLIARIYRPEAPTKASKRNIFIDYVMIDKTIDILKMNRLIGKKVTNAQFKEQSPVEPPAKIVVSSEHDLMTPASNIDFIDSINKDKQYVEWFEDQVDISRNDPNYKPIEYKTKGEILGKKIATPWVIGMTVPKDIKGVMLLDWLEAKDENGSMITKNSETGKISILPSKETILGKRVHSEDKNGEIIRVNANSVRISLDDGSIITQLASLVILLDDQKSPRAKRGEKEPPPPPPPPPPPKYKPPKVDKKNPLIPEGDLDDEEEEEEKDNAVDLIPIMYNGIYSYLADLDDPDAQILRKVNFVYQGPYWYIKIRSKKFGYDLLTKLQKGKRYIPKIRLNEINAILEQMNRARITDIEKEQDEVKNFFRIRHRKAASGQVKLYPVVENGMVYFVIDIKTHPKLNFSRLQFQKADGFWYYFPKVNKPIALKKVLTKIKKLGLTVSNLKEVKEELKEDFGINIR